MWCWSSTCLVKWKLGNGSCFWEISNHFVLWPVDLQLITLFFSTIHDWLFQNIRKQILALRGLWCRDGHKGRKCTLCTLLFELQVLGTQSFPACQPWGKGTNIPIPRGGFWFPKGSGFYGQVLQMSQRGNLSSASSPLWSLKSGHVLIVCHFCSSGACVTPGGNTKPTKEWLLCLNCAPLYSHLGMRPVLLVGCLSKHVEDGTASYVICLISNFDFCRNLSAFQLFGLIALMNTFFPSP